MCFVEPEDDRKGHVQLQLSLREEVRTPLAKPFRGISKLVIHLMTRFGVRNGCIPRVPNDLKEPWELDPEIFELEGSRALGTTVIHKQRAMIGKRRGEGREDVIVEV